MKAEIALIGNMNSGKTTLFNELTGDSKPVGNWTGTTVALDIGHFHYQGLPIDIVDLPGVYSLFTHSPEQLTVCEYLIHYHPDVIVNVIDSSNLERSLYLTTQLAQTGVPMVVALNMEDELASQGLTLDDKALSNALGLPCQKISATRRRNINKLLDLVLDVAAHPYRGVSHKIDALFSADLRRIIADTVALIDRSTVPSHLDLDWVALQMLEEHWQGDLPETLRGGGDDWELRISEERYAIIQGIVDKVLVVSPQVRRKAVTRRLDAVICHRVWALPIFIVIMLLIFFISFGPPGRFLTALFNQAVNVYFAAAVRALLVQCGAGPFWQGLLLDGVISGAGSVLVFLPQLMLLFSCLAVLEFSGYMARAAFIMDKLLAKFGLSGMSFIPMVLGFGCSVPAIMACRSLNNRGDRLLTMMVVPFMSCSSRMPVYAFITAAFFAASSFYVIGSMYLIGIVVALLTAMVLSPMIMKKEKRAFFMEMPPYRKPVLHCLWRSVWARSWDFIAHAGSVILIASIAVWFLSNFDLSLQMTADRSASILSRFGMWITPVFKPLGFDQWQVSVALLTGLMSKEVVVATLSVLYAGGAAPLVAALSPAAAYALLVFVLLYTPCIATIAAVKRESSSFLFTIRMVLYQLAVAWVIAFAVYHIGLLFIGGAS